MAEGVARPKSDLLDSIRRERGRLDALVASLSRERLTEPSLEGGRSVKDVLAHVSAWEKICMALVRNNQPIQPPPPGDTGSSTDVINEKVYEGSRDRPAPDVVAEAARSYGELVAMIEALSDEAVAAVLGAGRDGAEGSPTIAELVSENSDAHYREHSEQINRWLDGS